MIKVSVNNLVGRIIFFLLGSFPVFFYLFFKIRLGWAWHINLGFFIFSFISFLIFIIFLKFGSMDWDFYIDNVNKKFLYSRNNKTIAIDINTPFVIKTVFVGTFYFSGLKITFNTGESFYFRYKPFKLVSLLSSADYGEKVKQEIKNLLSD